MFMLNCGPLSLRQEEFSDGFWHCWYNFLICRILGFLIRAGNPMFDLCVHPWLVSFLPPICLMGIFMVWRDVCCVMGDCSFVFVLLINGMSMELKFNFLAKSLQGFTLLPLCMMSCKLTLNYMSASGANWLLFVLCVALRCGLIHNFSKCSVLNAIVFSHMAKLPTFWT